MRTWLITVGEPLALEGTERPWRTGLLARELAGRGHQVVWWTSRLDHFTKSFFPHPDPLRVENGVEVRFLEGIRYSRNVSLRRLVNHVQITRQFVDRARCDSSPDVLVASLPTIGLARAAVRFAAERRIPAIVDVRDLWPDEMYAVLPRRLRWLGRGLFLPLDQMTRHALAGATAVVATSEGYLEWARRRGRRNAGSSDLALPHGYPDPTALSIDAPQVKQAGERLVAGGVDPACNFLWFVGTFVGSIDLRTVIAAAREIDRSGHTKVQFVLSGSGEREHEWRRLAQDLPNVVFTGWINQPEMRWLAARARAGLAAYKPGALMSIPNKVIEYLGFGLPVVSSLTGEARRLLENHDCGLPYAASQPETLAAALVELLENPESYERMGRNARLLFEREFRATVVYAKYAELIEKLHDGSAPDTRPPVS